MNGMGLNYYNPPVMNGYSFGHPVMGHQLLGKYRQCPRGFLWNMSCNCCMDSTGDRVYLPGTMLGRSLEVQNQIDQANYDALPITEKVIQWVTDNPVLAIGAAAGIAYVAYKLLK